MLKFLRTLFILPIILSIVFTAASSQAFTVLPSDLDDDTLFLAATLWGEAKGSSDEMQIVANTIMNRKKYYEQQNGGKKLSIQSIVSNTDQYASWKGKNWDASDIIKNMAEYQHTDKASWETCLNYAKRALNNQLPDATGGATGYYKANSGEVPEWARENTSTQTFNDKVIVRGAKMEDLVDANNNTLVKGGTSYGASSWNSLQNSSGSSSSGDSCSGVESVSRDISSSTNSGYGIISDRTMQNMTNMMDRIYKNLGRVFMLGQGLLCYATKVAYACFGLDVPGVISACWIKSPNLSFFICGLAVYLAAFLMSIAIGMYFIDICFKLGFAVLYLPVSIALWPFAPTRSKFGQVFGMVLHNAMLYAMMSIGMTYAIILIYNGILGDSSNWTSFWSAIEKESSEILSENFSLNSTRIIVILFCLIFGFKIIASSVNNYLNFFFSDGLMGGQSPMHHLGTQAMHFAAFSTIGRVGGYATDFAKTQTGKVIEGSGDFLVNASQGDFGIVGKAVKSVYQPVQQGISYINRLGNGEFDNTAGTPTSPTPTGPTPTGPSSSGTTNASTTSSTTGSTPSETTLNASAEKPNSGLSEKWEAFKATTTPDANTLRPDNIINKTSTTIGSGISGTFNAVLHPISTYRTMSNLATQGVSSENSPFQNGKIIFKNTGDIVFRKFTPDVLQQGISSDNSFAQNAGTLGKNAAIEGVKIARATTSDSVGFAGRFLKGVGKSMQQNYNTNNSKNWWKNRQAEKKEEEIRQQEEDLINQTITRDSNDES